MHGVDIVTCKIQALLSVHTEDFFLFQICMVPFSAPRPDLSPSAHCFVLVFFLRCLFMPMLSVVPVCQCGMRCSKVAEI